MNPSDEKSYRLVQEHFTCALNRLREALMEDASRSDVIRDGVIQRFEFTFELAWKLLSAVLAEQGIEVAAPRPVIKEAFRVGLIEDGDGWIAMLLDRNRTSHLYDQRQAEEVFERIGSRYVPLLEELGRRMQSQFGS